MSVFTIENQGVNTYLVYKVSAEDEFDALSFGMLANNKIKGIAPILFTQVDADKYLKYNISSKIPVSTYFKGTVTRKKLLDVFSGIASAVMAAEEYMVDTSLFVFNIDYVYVDPITNETTIICVPVLNGIHSSVDPQMFFKQIMYSTQFDQNESCDYIAPIINYLNSTQVFSLGDFKKLVDRLSIYVPQSAPATPAQSYNPPPAAAPVQRPTPPVANTVQNDSNRRNERDTVAATPVQKTPVAPAAPVPQAAPMPPVPQKAPKKSKPSKKENAQPVQEVAAASSDEKQVTLMTLLTKFSKENLELYKAQKANGKPDKKEKKPKAEKPVQAPPMNFAIPGQTPSVATAATKPPVAQAAEKAPVRPQTHMAPPPVKAPAQANAFPPAPAVQSKPVSVQSANFGETTVLSAVAGETTVLGVAPSVSQPVAHLIRNKTGEKVAINKPVFRVGKEKSYVDYFISDNTAISRNHADIIMKNGNYYIVDLNSTNHTFVNEIIIESGTENLIKAGDKIRFGNEIFDFVMI